MPVFLYLACNCIVQCNAEACIFTCLTSLSVSSKIVKFVLIFLCLTSLCYSFIILYFSYLSVSQPESACGYGQWVLGVLGDISKRDSEYFHYCIHQMAAVPAASDALTRYTGTVECSKNQHDDLIAEVNLLRTYKSCYGSQNG